MLVTLATGTTGYAIMMELLEDGYPVRIFVRSRNKRALELEAAGAQIAIGEFDDYHQFKAALVGIGNVYYCYPIMKGLPENIKVFIKAARDAKINAVVFMGQWLSEFDNQESLLTNDIKKAYKLLEASELNVVYYNPGFFADNIIALTESVVQLGQLPNPFGNGECPWISTGDLARVAVALLKNPQPYVGKKVHPTGPKSITMKDVAAAYEKVLSKKIKLVPVPEWLFRKAIMAAAKEFGYNNFLAVQTIFYSRELKKGTFAIGGPTSIVKQLTGKEPEDIETIARDYVQRSAYGTPSFSKKLIAFKKFMQLPFTKVPNKEEQGELNM